MLFFFEYIIYVYVCLYVHVSKIMCCILHLLHHACQNLVLFVLILYFASAYGVHHIAD